MADFDGIIRFIFKGGKTLSDDLAQSLAARLTAAADAGDNLGTTVRKWVSENTDELSGAAQRMIKGASFSNRINAIQLIRSTHDDLGKALLRDTDVNVQTFLDAIKRDAKLSAQDFDHLRADFQKLVDDRNAVLDGAVKNGFAKSREEALEMYRKSKEAPNAAAADDVDPDAGRNADDGSGAGDNADDGARNADEPQPEPEPTSSPRPDDGGARSADDADGSSPMDDLPSEEEIAATRAREADEAFARGAREAAANPERTAFYRDYFALLTKEGPVTADEIDALKATHPSQGKALERAENKLIAREKAISKEVQRIKSKQPGANDEFARERATAKWTTRNSELIGKLNPDLPQFDPPIDRFKVAARVSNLAPSRWFPTKAMRPRSGGNVQPVIRFADSKFMDSGLVEKLQNLDQALLRNAGDPQRVRDLLDDFARRNGQELGDLRDEMDRLHAHIEATYKTNDQVGLRADLTDVQKQALLNYVGDMRDHMDDLLKGSAGENGREAIENCAKVADGSLSPRSVKESVAGLSKSAFLANNAYMRTGVRGPSGMLQFRWPPHLAHLSDTPPNYQWRSVLERQIDLGVYNPHTHHAENLSVGKIQSENLEAQWQNPERGLDHYAARDADGTGKVDFDQAETASKYADHMLAFMKHGQGQEAVLFAEQLKRLSHPLGGADVSLLPTPEQLKKGLGMDPSVGEGVQFTSKYTPDNKVYWDRILEICDEAQSHKVGAQRTYPFIGARLARFAHNNRINQHMAETQAYYLEYARRYPYHLPISTPGRNTLFNRINFEFKRLGHFMLGAEDYKPGMTDRWGLQIRDWENGIAEWGNGFKGLKVPLRAGVRWASGGLVRDFATWTWKPISIKDATFGFGLIKTTRPGQIAALGLGTSAASGLFEDEDSIAAQSVNMIGQGLYGAAQWMPIAPLVYQGVNGAVSLGWNYAFHTDEEPEKAEDIAKAHTLADQRVKAVEDRIAMIKERLNGMIAGADKYKTEKHAKLDEMIAAIQSDASKAAELAELQELKKQITQMADDVKATITADLEKLEKPETGGFAMALAAVTEQRDLIKAIDDEKLIAQVNEALAAQEQLVKSFDEGIVSFHNGRLSQIQWIHNQLDTGLENKKAPDQRPTFAAALEALKPNEMAKKVEEHKDLFEKLTLSRKSVFDAEAALAAVKGKPEEAAAQTALDEANKEREKLLLEISEKEKAAYEEFQAANKAFNEAKGTPKEAEAGAALQNKLAFFAALTGITDYGIEAARAAAIQAHGALEAAKGKPEEAAAQAAMNEATKNFEARVALRNEEAAMLGFTAAKGTAQEAEAKTKLDEAVTARRVHTGLLVTIVEQQKPKPTEPPKDEKPKDEKPKDEKPKDEKPKDEKPKDEKPKEPKYKGPLAEQHRDADLQFAAARSAAGVVAARDAGDNNKYSARFLLSAIAADIERASELRAELALEGSMDEVKDLDELIADLQGNRQAALDALSPLEQYHAKADALFKDIRDLKDQVKGLNTLADKSKAVALLAQLEGKTTELKQLQDEANEEYERVRALALHSEELVDDNETTDYHFGTGKSTKNALITAGGGEYGLLNQFFGDRGGGVGSVVGGWLTAGFNKISDGLDWWDQTKKSAKSQSERNMYNVMEFAALGFGSLVLLNQVAKWTGMSSGVKIGIMIAIGMYLVHRSGLVGQEMVDASKSRIPFGQRNGAGDHVPRSLRRPEHGGTYKPKSGLKTGGGGEAAEEEADAAAGKTGVTIKTPDGKEIIHYVVSHDGTITAQLHKGGMPVTGEKIEIPAETQKWLEDQLQGRSKHVPRFGDSDTKTFQGIDHDADASTPPRDISVTFEFEPETAGAGMGAGK